MSLTSFYLGWAAGWPYTLPKGRIGQGEICEFVYGFSNYFASSPMEEMVVVTNTFPSTLTASPIRAAPGNDLQAVLQQTPASALAQCG